MKCLVPPAEAVSKRTTVGCPVTSHLPTTSLQPLSLATATDLARAEEGGGATSSYS